VAAYEIDGISSNLLIDGNHRAPWSSMRIHSDFTESFSF